MVLACDLAPASGSTRVRHRRFPGIRPALRSARFASASGRNSAKISAPPITDTGSSPASASASSTSCATSAPWRGPAAVAGQDDVPAARQQPGQAVEGLAAHHHRAAHGQRLEALEVGGDVPWQAVVLADHAIAGAGDDDDDFDSAMARPYDRARYAGVHGRDRRSASTDRSRRSLRPRRACSPTRPTSRRG